MSRFIDEDRDRFGARADLPGPGRVGVTCYHRAAGKRSARQCDDERLVEVIRETSRIEIYVSISL